MKANLAFIRRHRKVLKIKVNAAEDLMLNGSREPSERGLCLHLLGKIDHATVLAALDRVSDPKARVTLLSGAVRATEDAGVLLLYLEALRDGASREVAAGAFSLGTNRIDWAKLSEARLKRLLTLLVDVFADEHERASALFALLHTPSFRALFDSHSLGEGLERQLKPLLAVYEELLEGKEGRFGRAALEQGASVLLSASEAILTSYPEPVRLRLLETAVRQMSSKDAADRAAGILLQSLPKDGEDFRRLSLARAGELLASHNDARARWHLDQLRKAQPKCKEASVMLQALRAKRLGRVALGWPQDWAERGRSPKAGSAKGGLQRAFWIDQGQKVWLQFAKPSEADRIEDGMALAGVAPVLLRGKAGDGRAWALYSAALKPAAQALGEGRHSLASRLRYCSQALALLLALDTRGLRLPDSRLHRFVLHPEDGLQLADLTGLRGGAEEQRDEGEEEGSARRRRRSPHRASGFGICRDLLSGLGGQLPPELERRVFGMKGSLVELRRAIELERAAGRS